MQRTYGIRYLSNKACELAFVKASSKQNAEKKLKKVNKNNLISVFLAF